MSGRTLLLLLGAALLLLGGCTTVEKRLSAKEYYNQANEAYDRENFSKAVDVYHDLLDQYPLNPYAEEAQLKIAYSYYIEKKYAEAIAGFNDFERAYPTSIHLPFVEYYRGMCYLEQMRSIDRDQSVTEKAYDHFRAVSDRFPGSSFSSLAEKKVRICRDAMAAHELMIADFYDKYDNTGAAKARLRTIIENYPETDGTAVALERLHNILEEEGKNDLADLAEQARAVRISSAISSEKSPQESATSEAPPALPPPGVDPLLLLVTELKKQENEQRQNAQTAIRAETKKMMEKANKVPTDQEEKEE